MACKNNKKKLIGCYRILVPLLFKEAQNKI